MNKSKLSPKRIKTYLPKGHTIYVFTNGSKVLVNDCDEVYEQTLDNYGAHYSWLNTRSKSYDINNKLVLYSLEAY